MIYTYKWNLSAGQDAKDEAMWRSVLDELLREDLIRPAGKKGEVYRLTGQGYEYGERYIEEQRIDAEKEPKEYIV